MYYSLLLLTVAVSTIISNPMNTITTSYRIAALFKRAEMCQPPLITVCCKTSTETPIDKTKDGDCTESMYLF
jgi:hypothetical protein